MNATWQIARLFGIPVKIHWTFALLLLYVVYEGYTEHLSPAGMIFNVSFTLALFLCVVLHEFGHALTARYYGVKTKDIILLPVGGVARLLHLPEKPVQEFVIAIAGPAVNVLIAGLLSIYLAFFHPQGFRPDMGESFYEYAGNFLPALFWLNIILVIFNMIPAFPMDGGRVLRAALSWKLGRYRATRIAAIVGQLVALLFIGWGVKEEQFMFSLVGLFVFFAAGAEFRSVAAERALSETLAGELMRSNFTRIDPFDPMQTPIFIQREGVERNFIVIDDAGRIGGVLAEAQVEEADRRRDFYTPVIQYMSSNWMSVDDTSSLKQLVQLFQQYPISVVPVLRGNELLGVIDREQLEAYLQTVYTGSVISSFWKPRKNKKGVPLSASSF